MAVVTRSLDRLRTGFNRLAPRRDKASDGALGDRAHAATRSGHNPDETGNAERSDADSKDEIRAIDVDDDLNQPGLSMQNCIDRILATPADRRRLIYIIYNGWIWSAFTGWKKTRYTGKNPHTSHGHFSGHPAYDEDDSPWSIERIDDMALTDTVRWVTNGDVKYAKPTATLEQAIASISYYGLVTRNLALQIRDQQTATAAALTAMGQALAAGGGSVDVAAILAHIDRRLAEVRADTRDAVADFAEGGADRVRSS